MRPPGQMNEPISIACGGIFIRGCRSLGQATRIIPLRLKAEFVDPFFNVGRVEGALLYFENTGNISRFAAEDSLIFAQVIWK